MTMRTVTKLTCECGHTGFLHTSENDQPYSKMWESHSLDGFKEGKESDASKIPLSPICPECGSQNITSSRG